MTNFSIREAAQSDLVGGGARVPKAIAAVFVPGTPTPSVSVFAHGREPRRGLAALLRVDRVRLAAQARARRRGRDGGLRAGVRRGRGALGRDGHPPRPRLRAVPRPRDRPPPPPAEGAPGA